MGVKQLVEFFRSTEYPGKICIKGEESFYINKESLPSFFRALEKAVETGRKTYYDEGSIDPNQGGDVGDFCFTSSTEGGGRTVHGLSLLRKIEQTLNDEAIRDSMFRTGMDRFIE